MLKWYAPLFRLWILRRLNKLPVYLPERSTAGWFNVHKQLPELVTQLILIFIYSKTFI